MSVPATVALIGNSQAYLDARAAVLQHCWLVETVALDLGQSPALACNTCDRLQEAANVEGMQSKLQRELYVVCSSLPHATQQEWVERLRAEFPSALIVRLDGFDSGPNAGADASVNDERGPAALVSTIYQLLTERGLPSRAWPEAPESGWLQ